MHKNNIGRPVDISGINVKELEEWLNGNRIVRKGFICQSMIALKRGVAMTEVCKVLGVTRESVRLWKVMLRNEGLEGLLKVRKVGKRSKLSKEKENELRQILKRSPKKQGYTKNNWTGALIQVFVLKYWGYKISLRTAQLWMARVN